MSDEFWRHYREKGGFLGEDSTEDESIYQAWHMGGLHGEPVTKLTLVPALSTGLEVWRIPYLQTIIQRYDRRSGQLCLMFPSSNILVFLQGQGLEQLDALIEHRRVKSIHMFDPAVHQPASKDGSIIKNIIIEQDHE